MSWTEQICGPRESLQVNVVDPSARTLDAVKDRWRENLCGRPGAKNSFHEKKDVVGGMQHLLVQHDDW